MGFSGSDKHTLVRFLLSEHAPSIKLLTTFGVVAGEVVLPKDCRPSVPTEAMYAEDAAQSGGSGPFPTEAVLLRNVHVTATGGNRFTFANLVLHFDRVNGFTLG